MRARFLSSPHAAIMSNLAAIIPAAQCPLEIREVDAYRPGANELLVRNEVIALNPVEWKIAKLNILPLDFPSILGSTFSGKVEEVGDKVTKFKVGDRVVALKAFGAPGNQYGAYQQHVIVKDTLVSKVPDEVDLGTPASIVMNLTCVVGLFTGRLGLDKPNFHGSTTANDAKILIYGGSSSFGSLAIQYLSQAGYRVITTSSPKNHDFVSQLGATTVVDHTLDKRSLIEQLGAEGPYEIVVDMISLPETISTTAAVLAAQGGGELYAMQPAFGPETLPRGVTRHFEAWSAPLYEERNKGLMEWTMDTYLPLGLSSGAITPLPREMIGGGLGGINEGLDRMQKGVSARRLVINPWE